MIDSPMFHLALWKKLIPTVSAGYVTLMDKGKICRYLTTEEPKKYKQRA